MSASYGRQCIAQRGNFRTLQYKADASVNPDSWPRGQKLVAKLKESTAASRRTSTRVSRGGAMGGTDDDTRGGTLRVLEFYSGLGGMASSPSVRPTSV